MTPLRTLRRAWRRLTSMRTALILLFLLAVAAVPGSLLPQRPLNPTQVSSYIAEHGGWGRFLDTLGMFDVFGSVWFAAVYLLLAISLVGCLVPRIRVYARSVARKPLAAPKYLSKLPESARFTSERPADEYASAAREVLGRRWRVERRTETADVLTLSAEKGYSREAGNLVFHVALLASLLLIAIGRLYNYEGSRILVQGKGFCNTVSQYDQWKPGRLAARGDVTPGRFCIDSLDRFTARYSESGEPRTFRADVTYRPDADSATTRTDAITVNHPLRLDGDRVYLINHGFAPSITVRMPDGTTRTSTAPFLPTNNTTYYSEGAFKLQGKPDAKQDVGISGFFAPRPVQTAPGVYASSSPDARDPVLGMFVYTGTINPNGEAESVYALHTAELTKIGAANLRVGQTKTFANGVSVTFDGWRPWASLQVSHDPAQGWLLGAAVAMVLGLGFSLGVRRRRLWIRVTPGSPQRPGSPTVVTVGGLARSDSGNFTHEFAAVVERLHDAGSPALAVADGSHDAVDDLDVVGTRKD
ncbi:cytochrome c biogenesis protein [Jatrophihabitans endophyticus]|uniref:Cytochrome c biogenesis protein n=1 Tax=Jatrophihabitans endophyticus TaxID=1206085 RepID=A0A1M5QZ20_9ACTN|nr:cytochrome c biogenesis protein ResB [Jatrophihabitans endophyticus]SHH19332.1 cytochrome c biogenesis protein [Jatrophihabitans endophyticus]